jgi:hypothetical protein
MERFHLNNGLLLSRILLVPHPPMPVQELPLLISSSDHHSDPASDIVALTKPIHQFQQTRILSYPTLNPINDAWRALRSSLMGRNESLATRDCVHPLYNHLRNVPASRRQTHFRLVLRRQDGKTLETSTNRPLPKMWTTGDSTTCIEMQRTRSHQNVDQIDCFAHKSPW